MTDTERKAYDFVVSLLGRDEQFVRLPMGIQTEIARDMVDEVLRKINNWDTETLAGFKHMFK